MTCSSSCCVLMSACRMRVLSSSCSFSWCIMPSGAGKWYTGCRAEREHWLGPAPLHTFIVMLLYKAGRLLEYQTSYEL